MLVREKRAIGKSKDGRRKSYGEEAKTAVWDLAVNQRQEVVKLAVPAALYAIQNTLLVSSNPLCLVFATVSVRMSLHVYGIQSTRLCPI